MSIRHKLESELADVMPQKEQYLIGQLVERLVPNTHGKLADALLLPMGRSQRLNPSNVTFNIRPQFIERVEGVVAQEINGLTQLNSEDRKLIELVSEHGGGKASQLISDLHELKDTSVPEAERLTAKQRINRFLVSVSGKLGDVALGVLQAYLEKKFIGG